MVLKGGYRDLAVFTIAQDEPEFIHAWVNHYKKHVAFPQDIFVLLHAATMANGTPVLEDDVQAWHRAKGLLTEHHGVAVQSVHHTSAFDHLWLAETVARFQRFLLSSYDWVLFAEIDEFLLPTPNASRASGGTLLELIQGFGAMPPVAVRASGFDVVHKRGEPPAPPRLYRDGTNVILTAGQLVEDRSAWCATDHYCKTLLANVPMHWSPGFHKAKGAAREIAQGAPSADLTLVHLHRVDFDLALGRRRRLTTRKWSEADIEKGRGRHNRIHDEDELRAWWAKDEPRLLEMPFAIKAALA